MFRHSDLILHFNQYAKNLPQPPPIHYTPQPREEAVGTQVLTEKKVLVIKYVDDNLVSEKVNFGNVSTNQEKGVDRQPERFQIYRSECQAYSSDRELKQDEFIVYI